MATPTTRAKRRHSGQRRIVCDAERVNCMQTIHFLQWLLVLVKVASWEKQPSAFYWLISVSGAPVSEIMFLLLFWIIGIPAQKAYIPHYGENTALQRDVQTDFERVSYEFQRTLVHVFRELHEKCSLGQFWVSIFTFFPVFILKYCTVTLLSVKRQELEPGDAQVLLVLLQLSINSEWSEGEIMHTVIVSKRYFEPLITRFCLGNLTQFSLTRRLFVGIFRSQSCKFPALSAITAFSSL